MRTRCHHHPVTGIRPRSRHHRSRPAGLRNPHAPPAMAHELRQTLRSTTNRYPAPFTTGLREHDRATTRPQAPGYASPFAPPPRRHHHHHHRHGVWRLNSDCHAPRRGPSSPPEYGDAFSGAVVSRLTVSRILQICRRLAPHQRLRRSKARRQSALRRRRLIGSVYADAEGPESRRQWSSDGMSSSR